MITAAFSSLGDKAEWRVIQRSGKPVPIALIVRVNAGKKSYLAVSKLWWSYPTAFLSGTAAAGAVGLINSMGFPPSGPA